MHRPNPQWVNFFITKKSLLLGVAVNLNRYLYFIGQLPERALCHFVQQNLHASCCNDTWWIIRFWTTFSSDIFNKSHAKPLQHEERKTPGFSLLVFQNFNECAKRFFCSRYQLQSIKKTESLFNFSQKYYFGCSVVWTGNLGHHLIGPFL